MDKIEIAKNVVKIVSGLGVTRIVGSIVANQAHVSTLPQKICVVVASGVIGSMAADAMGEYTDEKIDDVVTWYHQNVKS